jgi:hypothetical protein
MRTLIIYLLINLDFFRHVRFYTQIYEALQGNIHSLQNINNIKDNPIAGPLPPPKASPHPVDDSGNTVRVSRRCAVGHGI